jgi:hypothetical protein
MLCGYRADNALFSACDKDGLVLSGVFYILDIVLLEILRDDS